MEDGRCRVIGEKLRTCKTRHESKLFAGDLVWSTPRGKTTLPILPGNGAEQLQTTRIGLDRTQANHNCQRRRQLWTTPCPGWLSVQDISVRQRQQTSASALRCRLRRCRCFPSSQWRSDAPSETGRRCVRCDHRWPV